jgi:hypothetical protein
VDLTLPVQNGSPPYAVLDAIRFPSDPTDLLLEDKRSRSCSIVPIALAVALLVGSAGPAAAAPGQLDASVGAGARPRGSGPADIHAADAGGFAGGDDAAVGLHGDGLDAFPGIPAEIGPDGAAAPESPIQHAAGAVAREAESGSVGFDDMHADGEVVGVAILVDGVAHAAKGPGAAVEAGGEGAVEQHDLDGVGLDLDRRVVGGHVLVDQELVQEVGLVVEVEGAVRGAERWPHQIPQSRSVGPQHSLPLPGAQRVGDQ